MPKKTSQTILFFTVFNLFLKNRLKIVFQNTKNSLKIGFGLVRVNCRMNGLPMLTNWTMKACRRVGVGFRN